MHLFFPSMTCVRLALGATHTRYATARLVCVWHIAIRHEFTQDFLQLQLLSEVQHGAQNALLVNY